MNRIFILLFAGLFPACANGERLSDLNCFWAASDPLHPDDLFARSQCRGGAFRNYNSLDLLNTTTRFRRYHGDCFGAPDSEAKQTAISACGSWTTM